jgi:hypothetical protein
MNTSRATTVQTRPRRSRLMPPYERSRAAQARRTLRGSRRSACGSDPHRCVERMGWQPHWRGPRPSAPQTMTRRCGAITLRGLQPQMRLALQTADPHAHRDRARAHRLPLFDKLELDRALSWLEVQVQSCAADQPGPGLPQKRSLECSACGYGISCSRAPERCPMCQAEDGWLHASWRPFRRDVESVRQRALSRR